MIIMCRRILALVFLCLLIVVPAFAEDSSGEKSVSDILSTVDFSTFPINARYLSLSGAGTALERADLFADNNPANIASWDTGFSTPYVSFVLSNPDRLMKCYDTPSQWANTVSYGFLPIMEMNAGFNAFFKNFGFDIRVKDGLYSYADESNAYAGRSASTINVTDVSLGFATGLKTFWAWNYALSVGFYTALDAETRTNVLPAGTFFDVLTEKTLSSFIKEGATYLSRIKIPVAAGFVFEVPYGFAVGGTVKNRSLIVTDQLYSESGEKFCNEFKEDPKFVFDTILSIKYVDGWTGDIGVSWDLSRLLVSSIHNVSVAFDIVELRSLFTESKSFVGHIKVGAEYVYRNISLRAGWQLTGPSFGLGLSWPGITVDVAYSHVMSTGNRNSSADFFTPENNPQVAVTLKIGK